MVDDSLLAPPDSFFTKGKNLSMNDHTDVSLDDQIAEVQRELTLRRRVYPRWVQHKYRTHSTAMGRQIAQMEAVLATLQACQREAEPLSLFPTALPAREGQV